MPATLALDRYLDVIQGTAQALAADAAAAGLHAAVVTCPGWSVADLVAHQGMVHRWAAANVRQDDAAVPSKTEILKTVPAEGLLAWFDVGAGQIHEALRTAPADVQATVFLNDAPAPRLFWARRQAHETAIHSVDACAARLGRMPRAAEVAFDTDLALDGIDELLTGFFTRGQSKITEDAAFTVAVRPDDADCGWTLHVDERITTTRELQGQADVTFAGTALQLYLGLWNRGEEISAAGRSEVLERWREVQRVRWS